jgi:hypothetical protein
VRDNQRRDERAELEDQDGHERSLRLQAGHLSSHHCISRGWEAMLRLTHRRWKRTIKSLFRVNKTSKKNELDIKRDYWNEFVNSHKKADIFHTYDIARVYYFTSNYEPCICTVEENSRITGLALGEIANESFKFLGLTKRTIFYAEPIYEGNLNVLDTLLNRIKKESKGQFVQIRPNNPLTREEEDIYLKNAFVSPGSTVKGIF